VTGPRDPTQILAALGATGTPRQEQFAEKRTGVRFAFMPHDYLLAHERDRFHNVRAGFADEFTLSA
jgi:hypothetical protein